MFRTGWVLTGRVALFSVLAGFGLASCAFFRAAHQPATATQDSMTVTLSRTAYFDTPGGEIQPVAQGTYRVRARDGNLELAPGEGHTQLLAAVATTHDEQIDEPFALYNRDEGGNDHIVLLLPGGKGFEAVGTPAPVRPRGSWPPLLSRSRYHRLVRRRLPAGRMLRRPVTAAAKMPGAGANRGEITRKRFAQIVRQAFRGAYFNANASAGSYKVRHTTAYIPGQPLRTEQLERLEYKLGKKQIKRTEHNDGISTYRITKIRAAIYNWKSVPWGGSVENGKFVVSIAFSPTSPEYFGDSIFVKCSGWRQQRDFRVWHTSGSGWGDSLMDGQFQDRVLRSARFVVLLAPVVDNQKRVSYGGVQVEWRVARAAWERSAPYYTELPELRQMVIDYENRQIEVMRERIRAIFETNETRNRLATAIMETMAPELRGPVTRVIAQGSTVRVLTSR